MTKCNEELKELLEYTVIPDIEDAIDDIFEDIASRKDATKEQDEEIKELQDLRKEFTEILEDINNDELPDDECSELLEEITNMLDGDEE